MTTESINRLTIIGAGVVGIIVFGGLSVRHNIPAIERELGERATHELRQSRMSWAKVKMSGRDMTLSGVAPDAEARDAAMATAMVWGVRKVDSQLSTVVDYVSDGVALPAPEKKVATATVKNDRPTPAPAERFRTRLTVVDNRLVLDGAVPGERQRKEFIELAQARFSIASVEVQVRAQDNAPDGWLQAAALGLEIADQLVFGEVNLVDQSLHVTGITATTQGDELIRRMIERQLPEGYSGTAETGSRAKLDAVLRTSPELAQRLAIRTRTTAPVAPLAPPVLSESACEKKFRATLGHRRILYSTASATLTPESKSLLDELSDVLKSCSGVRIAIHGHTDDQGLMEDNLSLSQRRAESVMQHLVIRGVSLGRMSAQGYGEEQPRVPNETAADRAINRRIEFVFESG